MMLCHELVLVAAILSAHCCWQARADDDDDDSDGLVSLLQVAHTVHTDLSGQHDLVMAYVPYNFGHTVADVANRRSGIKWGDCGQRGGGDSCLGLTLSPGIDCQLMYTPGKYWPKDLATRYFGNKTIFGILRDPYERLVSQFRGSGSYLCPEERAKCDLNAGVRKMVKQYQASGRPFMDNCMLLPQAEYFDQPYGATLFVDNRKFPGGVNNLLQNHGYSEVLIRQEDIDHVSGCDDKWAGDLDAETKALVREVYQRDFELLCAHLGHCDDTESVCLTGVHGMCPEQLFRWDPKSEIYLKL